MNHDHAEQLAKDIRSQLVREWEQLRDQVHNPSNKGGSYEEGLHDLLSKYYGNVYDFYQQPVIIDKNLQVFDTFDTSHGQHEIDVVALFRQANPQIVFDIRNMTYVPLEGVAFICEVKNKVDSGRLENDLEKLSKVRSLTDSNRDLGVVISGDYSTKRQLLCLVYDQSNISQETQNDLLFRYRSAWDLMLVIDDDEIVINTNLPITDHFGSSFSLTHPRMVEDAIELKFPMITSDNALMTFFLILSASIPAPPSVPTIETMQSLRNII